jgi:hypothetical protein
LEGKGVGRVSAKMIGQRSEGGEVEMLYTRHVLLDRMWLAVAKEGGHLIGDRRNEEGIRLRRLGVDRARAKVGHVKMDDFSTFGRGGGKRNLIGGRGGARDDDSGQPARLELGVGRGRGKDMGPDVVSRAEGRCRRGRGKSRRVQLAVLELL